ncbi:MAG: toll/interleukin-1 receptor domain-containing protein [Acidimicrobiales bacterium]|nr:toll/interleukin-1 receptor domain-containing protein [Acidimicrobiales bacterium]
MGEDRFNHAGRVVLLRVDGCDPAGVFSQYAWREVGPLELLDDVSLTEILAKAASGSIAAPDNDYVDRYDVFLSRAGKESEMAQRFARCLQQAGLRVFLQNWHMQDRNFMERIDFGLSHSDRVLALLSHDYVASDYCKMEWSQVTKGEPLHESRRLVVLRVDDCQPVGLLATAPRWDLRGLTDLDDDDLTSILLDAASGTTSPLEANLGYLEHPPPIVSDEVRRSAVHFTGREDNLAALHRALAPETVPPFTAPVVIHGMGGAGKSTLAREYASRHEDAYAGIWWFNAEMDRLLSTFPEVESGFEHLGRTHFFGPSLSGDVSLAARRVYDFLRRECRAGAPAKPWLFVFDNADDEALHPWLQWKGSHAQVLLTTQAESVCNLGEHVVDLAEWALPDAHRFLQRACSRRNLTEDELHELTDAIGCLPLPLSHAAATIREDSFLTVDEYVARLTTMMNLVPSGSDYGKAVFATFQEAIAKAEQQVPGCRALMSFIACLGADGIPLSVLEAPVGTYPEPLRPVIAAGTGRTALAKLADLSLVRPASDRRTFSVHRMVQLVARDLLGEDLPSWRRHAVEVVSSLFPAFDPSDYSIYLITPDERDRAAVLEPHVDDVLAATAEEVFPSRVQLLLDFAVHLGVTGRSGVALPLVGDALAGWASVGIGGDPIRDARAHLAAAWVARRNSKMAEARIAVDRAIAILESVAEAERRDRTLAAALTESGALCWQHEDGTGAVEALTSAQRLLAEAGLDRSPEYGAACNYLGQVLYDQERFDDSLAAHELDGEICAEHFEADHPRRLVPLHNGAWARLELGEAERAHQDFLFDLDASTRLLGADHPQTAFSHEGIGDAGSRLAAQQNDPALRRDQFDRAQHHLERAVALFEQESASLGSDSAASVDLGDALQALGDHHQRAGETAEARSAFTRAAAIFSQTGRDDSPRRNYCLERLDELAEPTT